MIIPLIRRLRPEYVYVFLCLFSLEVQAQLNDNSQFVLAVATPSLKRPIGCNAKFWLSTGQQIVKNAPGSVLLSNEWWWEKDGVRLTNDGIKYKIGDQRENDWDTVPTLTYSGVHYYLEILNVQMNDYATYKFVVMMDDNSGLLLNGWNRYVDLLLAPAEVNFCAHPISFGARKEYLTVDVGNINWAVNGQSNPTLDHVVMVGPFTPTSGNPRERYQITGYDFNAKYSPIVDQCKRFGYNFKIQIFEVLGDGTANVVQSHDITSPLDALLEKYGNQYSDKDSFFPLPNPSSDTSLLFNDWTHQDLPVVYARGPLLIRAGQYVGFSTQGCITFLKGTDALYTNVPNQKSYYYQSPTFAWQYSTSIEEVFTFNTARPALIGETLNTVQLADGPFSMAFDAEFYDIEPIRVDPTPPPKQEDTSGEAVLIIMLIFLFCCLCCCVFLCFISAKNMKSTNERNRFNRKQVVCNISSESGEPLPPGWFEEKSPSGVPYYYNPESKESMWDIPCFG